jgi:hypothetical protein
MTGIEVCRIIDITALLGMALWAVWYYGMYLPSEVE